MGITKKRDEEVPISTWATVFLLLANLVFMECIYIQIGDTKKLLRQDLDACGFRLDDGLEFREWAKPDPTP